MKTRMLTVRLFSILLVAALLIQGCASATPAPPAPPAAPTAAPAAPAAATKAPAAPPAAVVAGPILKDKPVEAGERPVQIKVGEGTVTKFQEAPELAEKVAKGQLPPVEKRLPANPLVIKPEEAIGKYGGTLRMAVVGQNTLTNEVNNWWLTESLTNPSPQDATKFIPNVAESWEWSDGHKVLTMKLRKGIKWSDGQPFTAGDVNFWWQDVVLNKELTPSPSTLLTRGGKLAEFKQIDDFTIQFSFAEPYALFTTYLGSWGFPRGAPTSYPKHYLSQFHTKHGEKAKIEAGMKEGGFQNWPDFFAQKASNNNPERPTIGAWIPTARPPNAVEVHVRNPYYWKVDTAGNQLPYIGEIRSTRTADTEAALLKTIAGELDFSRMGGTVNLPVLSDNKQKGNYRFAYADWMPNSFGNIMFNFSTKDPVKNKLYNTKEFRQALSVAINREEIIKLIYKGGVFASQVAPMRGAPYHGESDLFQSWTKFNPDQANQMLDKIGLTAKDKDGFRLGPDGKELLLIISATTAWPAETPQLMDLVKGYWAKIGIKATVAPEAGALWGTRHNAGEHDVSARGAHFGGGPVHPTLNSNTFALSGWQWAPEWALWLDTGGKQGNEPPAEVKRIREILNQILGEPDEAKRNALMQEVFKIHMDQLWSIGLVVDDPKFGQLTTVHNRLRNVVTWSISGEWWPMIPQQWFIND
ncbi:MAG: ABC transporter substrate-binding protein [Chloroflexi bacterium]|nr:ABC transporter substrate-binding protein [Chloroflexota bacterium]